jgi:hypothetical protein
MPGSASNTATFVNARRAKCWPNHHSKALQMHSAVLHAELHNTIVQLSEQTNPAAMQVNHS